MLILTRRNQETLILFAGSEKIEIKIFGVKGSQVRLGIEANHNVKVYRSEIYDRLLQEKEAGEIHQNTGHCQ